MAGNRLAIEEQAATWLQKRDGEEWGTDDQARLSQWLDADTNHRVAFLRLEAAWAEMSRLRAMRAGRGRRRASSSRWVALAACLVVAIIGGVYFSTHLVRSVSYSTPVGGLTSIPLKDGSSVTLSSATVLRVRLGHTERRIELAQGEAFFEVAPDPSRPFIVEAGADRVIVVGTKFSVRRDGDDSRIVVTEGTVRVENTASTRLLPAGAVAESHGDDITVRNASLPDAESLLSWRSGFVVFHETALAEAVAEFNRYNPRKMVIGDSRVGAIRLTGKFRSTNVDSFSKLLQRSFPVRIRETPEGIVLSATE